MMIERRAFIRGMLILGCSIVVNGLDATEDVKIEQFLRTAPEGLKKWSEREKTGTSVVQLTTRTVEHGKTTFEDISYYTIYRSNPLIRVDSSGKDRNVSSVIIAGKDFGARLKRNANGSGFETKWLGKQAEVSDNLPQLTQGLGGGSAPWSLFGIPIIKIMSHPDFRVKNVELVQGNGKELWKVFFERITKDPKVGSMYDSWIMFDPKSDWAVIEAQYHFVKDLSVVYTIQNEYVKGADGVDRIKSAHHSTYSAKSKSKGHDDFEILEYTPSAPPDSRFEMTDLGLPDLKKPIESPDENSTRNWLFVGAFTLFMIALGFNRAARRST